MHFELKGDNRNIIAVFSRRVDAGLQIYIWQHFKYLLNVYRLLLIVAIPAITIEHVRMLVYLKLWRVSLKNCSVLYYNNNKYYNYVFHFYKCSKAAF